MANSYDDRDPLDYGSRDARSGKLRISGVFLVAVAALALCSEKDPSFYEPVSEGSGVGGSTLEVTPALAELNVDETLQFNAIMDGSDDVTADAIWSSSDQSIATVSNQDGTKGLATGEGEGQATITATLEDQVANATLVVNPAPVTGAATNVALTRDGPAGGQWLDWYTIDEDGQFMLNTSRDVSGDGVLAPGTFLEFMANIPGKGGLALPFGGSQEVALYSFAAGGIELVGSASTGTFPRWAGASVDGDFLAVTGDPPTAFSVTDLSNPAMLTFPQNQGFSSGIAVSSTGQVYNLNSDGWLYVNTWTQSGVTFTGDSIRIGDSGAHLSISPGGDFLASADPINQALHLIGIDGPVPELLETVQNIIVWNSGFGGDLAWDNVCLFVGDRNQEAFRSFTLDKAAMTLQEASGSPVDVPLLGGISVTGTALAAIGSVEVQYYTFGPDCNAEKKAETETSAGSFNLGVSFVF